jgi:hypothetical protein
LQNPRAKEPHWRIKQAGAEFKSGGASIDEFERAWIDFAWPSRYPA